jgi:hypothetical protein
MGCATRDLQKEAVWRREILPNLDGAVKSRDAAIVLRDTVSNAWCSLLTGRKRTPFLLFAAPSNLVDEDFSSGVFSFSVNELNSGDHIGEQLGSVQRSPSFRCTFHQLEHHRQARRTRA